MHRLLKESTCRNGKRRRVAKRSLNVLGGVSGLCGFVNNDKQRKEIRLNLQFADSLEAIKTAEKKFKRDKAVQKHTINYAEARSKLKLSSKEKFTKSHAEKLTVKQMKAVAFLDCGGAHLNGKAMQIREQLANMLPQDNGVPEYETQDMMMYDAVYSDTNDTDEDEDAVLSLFDLQGGDRIEVYWVGEKKWFEGTVTGISRTEGQFEIYYPEDKQQLWHNASEYSIRRPCD